jgi:hypothetical protein
MKKYTLQIELAGGIGNQLFRYFAGTVIAKELNCTIVFIKSRLPENHPQSNSLITDLKLSIPWENYQEDSKVMAFFRRKKNSFYHKFKFQNKLGDKVWGLYREEKSGLIKELELIERRLNSFKVRTKLKLLGHFQNIQYFKASQNSFNLDEFYPRAPSKEFNDFLGRAKSENLSIVHVRRTDFANHKATNGLLSTQYYYKALKMLQKLEPNLKLLVVSDDMNEAKKVIPREFDYLTEFSENSLPGNPAELLIALSFAKNFVLSNSSFILWSALLSQTPKYVIYPKPFNRDPSIDILNLPLTWIDIPSDFE